LPGNYTVFLISDDFTAKNFIGGGTLKIMLLPAVNISAV
jgi:hypothetical protein